MVEIREFVHKEGKGRGPGRDPGDGWPPTTGLLLGGLLLLCFPHESHPRGCQHGVMDSFSS